MLASAVQACTVPTAVPTLALTAAPASTPRPTAVSPGGATPAATYTPSGSPMPKGQIRLEFVPEGTQALYRLYTSL